MPESPVRVNGRRDRSTVWIWSNTISVSSIVENFTRTTPTHYLFEVTALWRAQYSIEAARPTAQEARLLGVAEDTACLIVVRRTFSRESPITIARLVHPGTRYALHGEFQP